MMIPPSPKHKRLQELLGLVLAFMLVAAASCSSELEGSGEAATDQRTVSVFTRVDIDNGADLTLTVDPSTSGDTQLTVTTDSNLIEFLTTRVADGELRVSPDRNGGLSTDLGFDVSGTAPSLESVTVNNGANATITGSVAQATLAADNGASIDGDALRHPRRLSMSTTGHTSPSAPQDKSPAQQPTAPNSTYDAEETRTSSKPPTVDASSPHHDVLEPG